MFITDFHIHSSFSDGKHSIAEIVDFYGKRGFGAIAITDHLCETRTFLGVGASYLNRTLTPMNFQKYMEVIREEGERAQYLYGMKVIPGFEITKNYLSNHRSAHILALGVSDFVSADDSIDTILKNIREQGALSIAAHPVSTRKMEKQTYHLWQRREELSLYVDAWEVASGPHLFTEVQTSGLPMIANSDLHRFSQMSSWKTCFEGERKMEAILEKIKKQKLSFQFYQEGYYGSTIYQHAVAQHCNSY
jgi:hypothetical protein